MNEGSALAADERDSHENHGQVLCPGDDSTGQGATRNPCNQPTLCGSNDRESVHIHESCASRSNPPPTVRTCVPDFLLYMCFDGGPDSTRFYFDSGRGAHRPFIRGSCSACFGAAAGARLRFPDPMAVAPADAARGSETQMVTRTIAARMKGGAGRRSARTRLQGWRTARCRAARTIALT